MRTYVKAANRGNRLTGRLAYIETEMAKRKGQLAADPAAAKDFDPQAELFRLAEKYEWDQQAIKDDEDGNVTNSLGMLTSIPEFDLGMESVCIVCGRSICTARSDS